jgi:hypothetical protein
MRKLVSSGSPFEPRISFSRAVRDKSSLFQALRRSRQTEA